MLKIKKWISRKKDFSFWLLMAMSLPNCLFLICYFISGKACEKDTYIRFMDHQKQKSLMNNSLIAKKILYEI